MNGKSIIIQSIDCNGMSRSNAIPPRIPTYKNALSILYYIIYRYFCRPHKNIFPAWCFQLAHNILLNYSYLLQFYIPNLILKRLFRFIVKTILFPTFSPLRLIFVFINTLAQFMYQPFIHTTPKDEF